MTKPKTKKPAKTVPKVAVKPLLPIPLGADAPARPWLGKSNLPPRVAGKPVEETKKPIQHPREAILRAFERLGGRRWLVKLGKQYPKEFASLLARMVPNEVNVSGTVGYAPLPIPVEQREPIPGVCVDITPPVVELDPFA